MAHPGGRPLKFKTPEEMQEKIDAYFKACDPHPEEAEYYKFYEVEKEYTDKKGETKTHKVADKSRPPEVIKEWRITAQKSYLITGLANFLETSRETLINYEKRDEFFDTIKAAKDKCEQFWELQLLGAHATGPIFNLKNNYGWKDKTEQDVNHGGEVTFTNDVPRPKNT